MKLLVFAHRGEAQAFFDHWEFVPVEFHFSGLFKTKNYFLLLTGEGPKEASEKTVAVLAVLKDQISSILNIGVAGSLTEKLKIGAHAWVRSSYAQNADKLEFKSFTTDFHDNLDCITSYVRINSLEEKKSLAHFADLVDRELWPIMSAAHLFKIKCFALKLISDNADSDDFCKIVKEEAPLLSKKMLALFLEKENAIAPKKEIKATTDLSLLNYFITHDALYFTTSQERRLQTLLTGFSIKKNASDEELRKITEDLIAHNIENRSPKEITKIVLQELSNRLNPLKAKIKARLEKAVSPLVQSGINVSTDPELEQEYVQISYQIKNTRDQKKLILALEYFNFQKVKDIFQGNIEDDL